MPLQASFQAVLRRTSRRERLLAALFFGAIFVWANLALLGSLRERHARLRADIAARQADIRTLSAALGEAPLWSQRLRWIDERIPPLERPDQAAVALLDELKETARAREIVIENPELGSLERHPTHQSVVVQITIKSPWPGLVGFLHALQTPTRFVAVEQAQLQIDPANPARLSARLKIAKYFKP